MKSPVAGDYSGKGILKVVSLFFLNTARGAGTVPIWGLAGVLRWLVPSVFSLSGLLEGPSRLRDRPCTHRAPTKASQEDEQGEGGGRGAAYPAAICRTPGPSIVPGSSPMPGRGGHSPTLCWAKQGPS